MCRPAAESAGTRLVRQRGEAPGGKLRHWERAALELRRVRRGSARIPLRGNPGRASTGKVPGRISQEPGSAAMRALQAARKEAIAGAGTARSSPRQNGGGSSPPLFSSNPSQVGGPGPREEERGSEVGGSQGKSYVKTLDLARHSVKRGSEGRQKIKYKLTPSLRAYFRARPEDNVLILGQGKMDDHTVKESGNGAGSGKEVDDNSSPPSNDWAHQESTQAGSDVSLTSQGSNLSTLRQEEEVLVTSVSSPPLTQALAPASTYSPSMGAVILSISEDIKKGFASSQSNQGEIREACEALEKKFDSLMERIQTLEETVGGMKEELKHHKDEMRDLNEKEQGLQARIKQLENYSRRNNIKLLEVPEGAEGENLKSYVVSLIKFVCGLEESKEEIKKDIQRVHRDLFTRRPNSTRPRKILVNFLTYPLKEKMLSSALKQKSLRVENVTFKIRSDLSKLTMDRQWELGKRLDEFKKLGAMAQLKFPAFLRIIHNNKMYNIRDVGRADKLLDAIRREQADHV
ncbi:hypothetical protein NDU88_005334 [Pleurodeles waltl]|uniref:Uncharacterized protein n=1 Tax=Pleurodeles waltl TaxID=8319 RepID=A0AAV7VLD5_PLEWA|nr:hypothetical protein NDU88_005334 [Pleurodeles waltl]